MATTAEATVELVYRLAADQHGRGPASSARCACAAATEVNALDGAASGMASELAVLTLQGAGPWLKFLREVLLPRAAEGAATVVVPWDAVLRYLPYWSEEEMESLEDWTGIRCSMGRQSDYVPMYSLVTRSDGSMYQFSWPSFTTLGDVRWSQAAAVESLEHIGSGDGFELAARTMRARSEMWLRFFGAVLLPRAAEGEVEAEVSTSILSGYLPLWSDEDLFAACLRKGIMCVRRDRGSTVFSWSSFFRTMPSGTEPGSAHRGTCREGTEQPIPEAAAAIILEFVGENWTGDVSDLAAVTMRARSVAWLKFFQEQLAPRAARGAVAMRVERPLFRLYFPNWQLSDLEDFARRRGVRGSGAHLDEGTGLACSNACSLSWSSAVMERRRAPGC